jgi:hypothetical protein
LGPGSKHELYVAAFLVCGVIAAVLISAAVLFVIRRHARSKEKLLDLNDADTEASKDYQVLTVSFQDVPLNCSKPYELTGYHYLFNDRGLISGKGKGFFLQPLCPDQL